MIDVGDKPATRRRAVARAHVAHARHTCVSASRPGRCRRATSSPPPASPGSWPPSRTPRHRAAVPPAAAEHGRGRPRSSTDGGVGIVATRPRRRPDRGRDGGAVAPPSPAALTRVRHDQVPRSRPSRSRPPSWCEKSGGKCGHWRSGRREGGGPDRLRRRVRPARREDATGEVLDVRACAARASSSPRAPSCPDERAQIAGAAARAWAARPTSCSSTGGTGFAPRDVTPEAHGGA